MKVLSLIAALILAAQAAVAGCGDTAQACEIEGGTYHVSLPAGAVKGSVMFLHGFGGSGAGTLGNRVWVPEALKRGYVVIAPDGMERANGKGRRWYFHPDWPAGRDDIAFLQAVRDDAEARFGLAVQDMALGGFSIGGSMTSYLACAAPDSFAAYLPVGGGFWRPHPMQCAGPVRLLHTHGWRDTTVPLEGRAVRGVDIHDPEAFVQGDIFHGLNIWRQTNGCVQSRADRFADTGPFMRRSWVRCSQGSALEFALFAGGHRVPEGWAEMALDWVEALEER